MSIVIMKYILNIALFVLFYSSACAQVVSLNPDNPHYLNYQDKPVLLITSGEHYGSVINLDFDYKKYLQTLKANGLNYTRIFSGTYVGVADCFDIKSSPLSPEAGRFLAPWKSTNEIGLYKGEKKFDLNQWNDEYFDRLKDFLKEAEKIHVVVEFTFFCSTYTDSIWKRNPFNPGNNINCKNPFDRKKVNTILGNNITDYQLRFVEKVVNELNSSDNLFYEIVNEPWTDDPTHDMRVLKTLASEGMDWVKWSDIASHASLEWQKLIASTIVETENNLPKKHLIAQNYSNFMSSIDKVDKNVSILNFHYAWPQSVWLNYGWNRPVSFDESGFDGNSDLNYIRQAWQFILAGGAIFNNLDFSFFCGHEDGTYQNIAPGGGSKKLREMLNNLHVFMNSFDFVKMAPDFDVVSHSPGLEWHALSEEGKNYAIYLDGRSSSYIKLKLPVGEYQVEFFSPLNGKQLKATQINVQEKQIQLNLPDFDNMIALKIVKQ
jgi:hypothetical protein